MRDPDRWRTLVSAVVDHVTAEVVPALRDEGIRCILLKGPATVARLYDDPLERPYEDADLLIEPSRFEDARNVLRRLGFAPVAPSTAHRPRIGR